MFFSCIVFLTKMLKRFIKYLYFFYLPKKKGSRIMDADVLCFLFKHKGYIDTRENPFIFTEKEVADFSACL